MPLDETGKTEQDISSAKKTSSGGKTGTTSEKTFTQIEQQKAISDALSKAGRDAVSLGAREKAITAREEVIKSQQAEMETVQNRLDELERQGVGNNPEAVTLYQERKQLRDAQRKLLTERADLEKSKAEHAEEIKTAREHQWENTIYEIAHRYNIESNLLEDLNLTSPEQAEVVAKAIADAKTASGQGAEGTEGAEGATSGLTPDSTKGKGGTGELTPEQLGKLSMSEYAAYTRKRDEKK